MTVAWCKENCLSYQHCLKIGIGYNSVLCQQKKPSLSSLSWPKFFMSLVYLIAQKSKDPRSHVGAVIVGTDNTIISVGYNGLPRNIEYKPFRIIKPDKKYYFEHAERNAIYNSIRNHSTIQNATIYTNGIPCPGCARALIQTGIKTVVIDITWDKDLSQERIIESNITKDLFEDSDIKLKIWSGGIISKIEKFQDGEVI